MRTSYYEGVAARMLGLPIESNPYRNFIRARMANDRDAEREYPDVYQYARDFDSGHAAAEALGPAPLMNVARFVRTRP